MPLEYVIESDVLVIGAGMAGFFAAITARERVNNVTLIDKGFAGKSAVSHFAEGDFTFLKPDSGHDINAWIDQMSQVTEYLNNQQWDRIIFEDSYERYNDLVSWGVELAMKDGEIHSGRFGVQEHHCMVPRKYVPMLRKKALEVGVNIIDRIMLGELIKHDGRIVGGIGFHTTSGDLHIFKANAVVLAAGGSSLKIETQPVHVWTSDGDSTAYRAGAVIAGKEFVGNSSGCVRSTHKGSKNLDNLAGIEGRDVDLLTRFPNYRANLQGQLAFPTLNCEGGQIITNAWEAHCGRAPLYIDHDNIPNPEHAEGYFMRIGTAENDKIGLNPLKGGKLKYSAGREETVKNVHSGSGIWPVDTDCSSNIPGLYCAGNNCATMTLGAVYGSYGIGLLHAAVTGARAGKGAAKYSRESKSVTIDNKISAETKKLVCEPMERKGGFSPRWTTQVLQGIMVPYFIMNIKHEKRLQAALTLIEFMNQHLVPKLVARDPHEWRLAQETRNMVLNAEMTLRASLFRTESRGVHFREDFPRREDPEWLAWVKLKDENGVMQLSKEQIPQEWWPDLSLSYEERYPKMLPMEEKTVNHKKDLERDKPGGSQNDD